MRADEIKLAAEKRRAEKIAANGWDQNDPEPVQPLAVEIAEECWPKKTGLAGLVGQGSLPYANFVSQTYYDRLVASMKSYTSSPLYVGSSWDRNEDIDDWEIDPKHGAYVDLSYMKPVEFKDLNFDDFYIYPRQSGLLVTEDNRE